MNISQRNKEAFKNPWVLAWIGGVVLVFGVNIAFIITAIITNPGLVEKDYYEKGQDHERRFIQKQELRHRLGWHMVLNASIKPVVAQPVRYTLNIVDRNGVPVDGEQAWIKAYRPSDAQSDFEQALQKIAPGVYSAELVFPLKGIWDLTAGLSKDGEQLEIKRRISVLAH